MSVPDAKRQKTGSEVVLYSYWRSSCSYRVRIALNIKGIKYKYEAVHLLKDGGEQLKEGYAALNPMKELPTLQIDGLTLTQSGAIIEYLDETRRTGGVAPLLPHAPEQRALVRAICQIIGGDTQPVQNLRVLRRAMSLVSEDDKTPTKMSWGKWAITNGFDGVEALLRKTAGKYCVGDTVTKADLFLVPQVYNARRFKVDMTRYPIITRVDAALTALPAFQAAHPSEMPDAQ